MSHPAQLCTIADVAACLKISRSAAYRLVNFGELEVVRVGERSLRVTEKDLANFVARNREVAT